MTERLDLDDFKPTSFMQLIRDTTRYIAAATADSAYHEAFFNLRAILSRTHTVPISNLICQGMRNETSSSNVRRLRGYSHML